MDWKDEMKEAIIHATMSLASHVIKKLSNCAKGIHGEFLALSQKLLQNTQIMFRGPFPCWQTMGQVKTCHSFLATLMI